MSATQFGTWEQLLTPEKYFEISKKFEQKFPRLRIAILRTYIKFCKKKQHF
jgi:hypothetical protein